MPIIIQDDLPAKTILENENIFFIDEKYAISQEICPLEILILNLMPIKEDTETQLLRALSNSPLPVKCTFMTMSTHVSSHTSVEHMEKFYVTFDQIQSRHYDGMIITGAPVENMEFEAVDYWDELTKIMDWSNVHVTSTLHLCWGAQAGLYYHHGIKKYYRKEKISGIYKHRTLNRKVPLLRGFDDSFYCPHSRNTEVLEKEITENPNLHLLAVSEEAGVLLVMNEDGSEIFLQGHLEYDRMTLDQEYHRDMGRGLNPKVPEHYYENDDPTTTPPLVWRNAANTFYTNWLNFYVCRKRTYCL